MLKLTKVGKLILELMKGKASYVYVELHSVQMRRPAVCLSLLFAKACAAVFL